MQCNLRHDEDPKVDHTHVQSIRPLRPITQRQNKTCNQSTNVRPLEHDEEDLASRPNRFAHGFSQNPENQEEVADSEPREKHTNSLIDELDKKHHLPNGGMIAPEDIE